MKIECESCGSTDIRYESRGPHIAAYCNHCHAFIKFVKQSELPQMTNFAWLKTLDSADFAAQLFFRQCVQGRNIDEFVEWLDKIHTKEDEL